MKSRELRLFDVTNNQVHVPGLDDDELDGIIQHLCICRSDLELVGKSGTLVPKTK